jgi:hypothetical protein
MNSQTADGCDFEEQIGRFAALRILAACLLALGVLFSPKISTAAENDPRRVMVEKSYLASHWQLARWHTGQTVCNIYSRLDGPPAAEEVTHFCGESTYQEWFTTPICNGLDCSGLMLRYMGRGMHVYQELVKLPRIFFKATLSDCIPGQICSVRPRLMVDAVEPVEGHRITRLYLRTQDRMWMYEGNHSLFELPITGEQGTWLEYWAVSDLGDESERVRIRFRTVPLNENSSYQVDLVGKDWAEFIPSGSLIWDLLPPIDEPLPKTLEQPLNARYLTTTNRYVYLAGQLIRSGYVNAAFCPSNGLLPNGTANACGEEASADQVLEWQNRYDQQIFNAAQRHDVPPRVLKGIIAQESQFWPDYGKPYELGLGMLTENGLDLLLTWNLDYYLDVCNHTYTDQICSSGYAALQADQQLVLRGALLQYIGTEHEFDLLAATLAASATQMRQLVRNTLLYQPVEVTTYEDMWKLTTGNYYAGSGCIGNALKVIADTDVALTWEEVTRYMVGDCDMAPLYVERVFSLAD